MRGWWMMNSDLSMGRKNRYCNSCDAETPVHTAMGNNGRIEYCPRCSFPYAFGSGGVE